MAESKDNCEYCSGLLYTSIAVKGSDRFHVLPERSITLTFCSSGMLYVWSETEASPAPKSTGKAGFRTDLGEL